MEHARTQPESSTQPAAPQAQAWVQRYDGRGGGDDSARSVVVGSGGSKVFVTGYSTGSSSGEDYGTVAYDAASGTQLWGMPYDGPGSGTDVATAIGVSPDGSRVFVTGYSDAGSGYYDYATVAYEASTGTQMWATRYNGPGNLDDQATSIGVSPGGSRVFVTGYSIGSTGHDGFATVSYDSSTGTQLWVKRYKGPADTDNKANALGVNPGGSVVYVTGFGYRSSNGPSDFITVAYDASTGSRRWVKRYNGPANRGADALGLAVSPGGSRVFVTGYVYDAQGYADYATVGYDSSTGARLWSTRYNGPADSDDIAVAVGVSPGGSQVFVTGYTIGSTGGYDYGTVAYDASTGAQLWGTRYNGPANSTDQALALAMSPDGTLVFVSGYSVRTGNGDDYGTVAYDSSTGAQVWAESYDGPVSAGDEAFAIAVTPDGSRVFVTGQSTGSTGTLDYATVAYGA